MTLNHQARLSAIFAAAFFDEFAVRKSYESEAPVVLVELKLWLQTLWVFFMRGYNCYRKLPGNEMVCMSEWNTQIVLHCIDNHWTEKLMV